MVGDGDAMRIASQIMQHMFGAAEGRLGIDDPVLRIEGAQEDGEALLVLKWDALTEEAQLIAGKEAPQSGDELAAEDTTEHLDRQQKSGTRCDPARVVCRESSAGDHAVDVGMWSERLSPVCAPRCLGSAKTSSSVAALASKSKQNSCRLFCQISGTSSCGTLKTR